jgi:hypothetical protein
VLKGDLSATPLPDVLTGLAAEAATGCLHIDDDAGDEALVYLKDGAVYAAYVPGRRPQLGARLISSGALAPEALAEALEAQETELQGWRLGELLVHLGYVERSVVEAFVLEQLREAAYDLSRWRSGRFRFRKNEKTREDVSAHAAVASLLEEVSRRAADWDVLAAVVHGADAVPVLSAGGVASGEMTLDQDQWALLCKVDGERSVAQLARDCGFTTFESAQIVYSLVTAGLLDVEDDEEEVDDVVDVVDEDFAPLGAALASAFAAPVEDHPGSAMFVPLVPSQPDSYDFSDFTEVGDVGGSEIGRLLGETRDLPVVEPSWSADDPFSDSLARVSEALSALLGDALPARSLPEPPAPVGPTPEEIEAERAEVERLERSRAAAAAELAEAHALAEAQRHERKAGRAAQREAAERLEAERLAAEEAARVAAEQAAETARVEAELLAAAEAEFERLAAESARLEAERLEAERVAAERAEAERREAEQAEFERLAAESARLDAERAEAERTEATRIEAERIVAEAAAAETARQEAERLEAERVEAERVEAERVEAERVAAEQAAADLAAEAERVEAERVEAERLDAERAEAERAEFERLAAEQAAADLAAEAERVEAERVEAERVEAERVAAELAAAEEVPYPVDTFGVASMLRDLNDTTDTPDADTVEVVEELDEPPAPPEQRSPEPDLAPSNGSRAGLSDTAALLRELTSLGLDDDAPQPPAARTPGPSRPAVPAASKDAKKRKGLFGRG